MGVPRGTVMVRFVAFDRPDRPLCDLCGPRTHKRAVFFEVRRKRSLCARCAVERLDSTEARRPKPEPALAVS